MDTDIMDILYKQHLQEFMRTIEELQNYDHTQLVSDQKLSNLELDFYNHCRALLTLRPHGVGLLGASNNLIMRRGDSLYCDITAYTDSPSEYLSRVVDRFNVNPS